MLLSLYISGLDFKVNFSISANFGIQTLFLNFKKTLFELRSFCNRFLRCIYLDTYTELEQIMFQVALVNLFSLCILETFTTLSSAHVVTKTPGKYSQVAIATLFMTVSFTLVNLWSVSKASHSKCPWLHLATISDLEALDTFQRKIWFQNQYPLFRIKGESP